MIFIRDIQRIVADQYEIPIEVMSEPYPRGQTNRNPWPIARHRQEAMYLASCLTRHSYSNIGRMFNRDHSTVMYAVRATRKRLTNDKDAQEAMRRLARKVMA